MVKTFHTRRYQLKDAIRKLFNSPVSVDSSKKVSLIIPTLSKGEQANHLPMLKRLLSVYLPYQTHKNYEVLVYCDGPNDEVKRTCESLKDNRIRLYYTESTFGKWGHPQTRLGIESMTGDFFVRMNDDNRPYKEYLQSLIGGFNDKIGIVYARVIYKGEARERYSTVLLKSYIIPNDRFGILRFRNLDCMNYMVKAELARKYSDYWNDSFGADWFFIEAMLKDGVKANFIDRIIGEKF